ncbi:FimV/HubP family polar landmark protein [Pseudomonas sp. MWU13-2105]|uniref:FimV/HubP family polar landmark protein n=1 Tax=Pseudomonas sp. MWU13-2105 TaxID=2935074 RepID=UPI00399B1A62
MNRARLLAVLAGGLLYSALAPAMGLGDITLHSALNQPLNAEIALIEPGDLAEGELSVSLATPEEFSRAGVERVFFLNNLRFTPVLRGNSSVIQVQTSKPVSEPFLNFLVQVNRPNGRLLREYTVLLDPPGNLPAGYSLPARSAALEQPATLANIPPPPAVQGKHYTVVKGDHLWSIAKRLHEAGSQASVNELSQGIRALNPGSDRLRVGQSLLLPDVAVVAPAASALAPGAATGTPAAVAQNPAALAAETLQNAEELAKSALENQQLQKTVEDLQGRLKAQDELIAGSQKQALELQTQLAQLKAKAAAPAPAVVSAPVVPPTAAAQTADGPNWLLWAAVLLLIALLAVAFILRRNRRQAEQAPEVVPPVAPAPDPMVSRVVAPAQPTKAAPPASTRIEPVVPAAAASRQSSEVSDALEGVSIYIAYGRFSEAAGILREAMLKEPERTDLHLRLLEVLAQQGDSTAYATEERNLLQAGFSESTLQALRAKYPKLQTVTATPPAPAPIAASPAAVLAAVGAVAAPVLAADWSKPAEPAAASAAVAEKPLEDEFQLNLDDLSMDADWDLVSPFDNTPQPRSKSADEAVLPVELEPEPEPMFSKSFNELPEVFEMPDEQFLSDFSELESEPQPAPVREVELSLPEDGDSLDDAFLDGFMSDPEPLDIEPLEVDFDSLEREHASASKLEQAQTCINVGDLDHASQLLHELLREGDEPLKQTVRTLLASIR